MFGIIATITLMAVIWTTMVVAFLAYNSAVWGFVLAKCWLWLVVPTFGMVALTFTQALVVGMLISIVGTKTYMPPNELFDSYNDDGDDKAKAAKKKRDWFKIGYYFILPWMTLIVVWIVKIIFL
jgi:hypothetical protein